MTMRKLPVLLGLSAVAALITGTAALAATPANAAKPAAMKTAMIKPAAAKHALAKPIAAKPAYAAAARPRYAAPRAIAARPVPIIRPGGRMVQARLSNGKTVSYNCSLAGNQTKQACKR